MKPAGRSESLLESLITAAAREAVMEEATGVASSITVVPSADRQGPELLLDVAEPDQVRVVRRYCGWLFRGLPADSLIAARFDRSFQRLRRLGREAKTSDRQLDMPCYWNGPEPSIQSICDALMQWCDDDRLADEERHVIRVCINECQVRLNR